MFALDDLLSAYGPPPPSRANGEAVVFSGVAIDSRQAQPGNLFVALPGEQHDGHDFIAEALRRGCRGALAQAGRVPADLLQEPSTALYEWVDPHWQYTIPAHVAVVLILVPEPLTALQRLAGRWRERFSPTVVGITGSVGKSSTKEVIAAVLARCLLTLKSEKSYNNEIGLPLTLLELRPDHQAVVLEMGTYGPGEIALLAQIARPQVGVVTNVSHSHLERMGSLEIIARAKSELPAALPADGLAVLNGDEALIRSMAAVTSAPVLFYGQGEGCDVRAVEVRSLGLDGIAFTVKTAGASRPLRCALAGRHSVYAALAAIAVGRHLDVPWDDIQAGLLDTGARLRLVRVPGEAGSTLLDDTYNASPVSCRAALELLAELPGRKIAVLGDMLELGTFEAEGHRLVGQWAAGIVQELYVVGKRARSIGEAATAAGLAPSRVFFAPDPEAAIAMLRGHLKARDVVLVKGSRAMAMDRIVDALKAS
jgi:UDP-N-acetylmuramoyl-tripeptide--D-alanyl-D-alanine ligase